MANAPQKVTRAAEVITEAPPARAAKEPKSMRNNSELTETTHSTADTGTRSATKRGKMAPIAKLPAEANAA